MHSIEIRGARIALVAAASLCLLSAPALGDGRPWEQPRWNAFNHLLFPGEENTSLGQRASEEDTSLGQLRLESQLHTHERHGFEYSRHLSLNFRRKFILNIQGPLISERAPGLAFELRF